jgi:hypothetical protein
MLRNISADLLLEILPDRLKNLRIGPRPFAALPFAEVIVVDSPKDILDKFDILNLLEVGYWSLENVRSPLQDALLLLHYNCKILDLKLILIK